MDKLRKQLVVYVVNQSKNKPTETTISLTSGEFKGNAEVYVINGPDVTTENTPEKPEQVAVKVSNLKVKGASFTHSFEPHSITALVLGIE